MIPSTSIHCCGEYLRYIRLHSHEYNSFLELAMSFIKVLRNPLVMLFLMLQERMFFTQLYANIL